MIRDLISPLITVCISVFAIYVFDPLIRLQLDSIVMDTLSTSGGLLDVNVQALVSARTLIIMGFEFAFWFIVFTPLVYMFFNVAFKRQEESL